MHRHLPFAVLAAGVTAWPHLPAFLDRMIHEARAGSELWGLVQDQHLVDIQQIVLEEGRRHPRQLGQETETRERHRFTVVFVMHFIYLFIYLSASRGRGRGIQNRKQTPC